MSEDQPTMTCPKCGAELPDFDGFGVLAHTKPAYPDGCGYCSHPSRDATPEGWMKCGICGDVDDGEEQRGARMRPSRRRTTW